MWCLWFLSTIVIHILRRAEIPHVVEGWIDSNSRGITIPIHWIVFLVKLTILLVESRFTIPVLGDRIISTVVQAQYFTATQVTQQKVRPIPLRLAIEPPLKRDGRWPRKQEVVVLRRNHDCRVGIMADWLLSAPELLKITIRGRLDPKWGVVIST